MDDENKLVNKIIHGDQESFTILVKKYEQLVAHIVYSHVRNPDDRNDLCQEIFLKVYVNLGSFEFRSKLSTWIGRVSYNACMNHLKKKQVPIDDNIHRADATENYETGLDTLPSADDVPDSELHRQELSDIVERTIRKLPRKYRLPMILFYMDDLSYTEISKILGVSMSNVKVLLFRARKMLKDCILEQYREEELWQ